MEGLFRTKPDKYYHFGFVEHPTFGKSEFIGCTRPWQIMGQTDEEDATKGDYTEVMVKKLGIMAGKNLESALAKIDEMVFVYEWRGMQAQGIDEALYNEYKDRLLKQLQSSEDLSLKEIEERKKCACGGTGWDVQEDQVCPECRKKAKAEDRARKAR